jgi:hypothetical protein
MDILAELENFIKEFNQNNNEYFNIDTIRIEFDKQHKKDKLLQFGNWKKINKNDRTILSKLKERLTADEITTAYQLEKHNIYYYNQTDETKKYRKATMVIFGMKQYHKDPPPKELMQNLLSMLVYGTSKVSVNIDVCSDTAIKPNIHNLMQHFTLKQYVEPITKTPTETYYINHPNITMIEKLVIYNKRIKNNLNFNVWRLEALIEVPNIRFLALPLHEFKQIIDISKGIL